MLKKVLDTVLGVFRIRRRPKDSMPVEEVVRAEPEESDTGLAREDETEEDPGEEEETTE